jgi:hypothetical protein
MEHVEVLLEASVTPTLVSPLSFIIGSEILTAFCLAGFEAASADVSEEHVAIQATSMKQAASKAFFRNVGWLLTDYTALYPRR